MPKRTVNPSNISLRKTQALHALKNVLEWVFVLECSVEDVRTLVTKTHSSVRGAKRKGSLLNLF